MLINIGMIFNIYEKIKIFYTMHIQSYIFESSYVYFSHSLNIWFDIQKHKYYKNPEKNSEGTDNFPKC